MTDPEAEISRLRARLARIGRLHSALERAVRDEEDDEWPELHVSLAAQREAMRWLREWLDPLPGCAGITFLLDGRGRWTIWQHGGKQAAKVKGALEAVYAFPE